MRPESLRLGFQELGVIMKQATGFPAIKVRFVFPLDVIKTAFQIHGVAGLGANSVKDFSQGRNQGYVPWPCSDHARFTPRLGDWTRASNLSCCRHHLTLDMTRIFIIICCVECKDSEDKRDSTIGTEQSKKLGRSNNM